MHIPSAMLHGAVCPVTAAMSATGLVGATAITFSSQEKPSAARFSAVTALIFAAQMMNFPILNGTSGHLLGGVLAAALLGTPFAVLSLAIVLTIQSLVFSDGGLSVLGANILNMSLIGAGIGGSLLHLVRKSGRNDFLTLGVVSWISVMLAALACSAELALGGAVSFSLVAPAMLGTHALIGIGEALITVATVFALGSAKEISPARQSWVPLTAAGIIALILSPFASSFPDGLTWVSQKYNFFHESAPTFVAPLANYSMPWLGQGAVSTAIAGFIGVAITFVAAMIIGQIWAKRTA